ncbi:hypothetical protein HK104_011390 [Borealophlyctis nickersoniae]|nr:hypothetical protein HK104_011390 [Borealophlyctis nickersoniae]
MAPRNSTRLNKVDIEDGSRLLISGTITTTKKAPSPSPESTIMPSPTTRALPAPTSTKTVAKKSVSVVVKEDQLHLYGPRHDNSITPLLTRFLTLLSQCPQTVAAIHKQGRKTMIKKGFGCVALVFKSTAYVERAVQVLKGLPKVTTKVSGGLIGGLLGGGGVGVGAGGADHRCTRACLNGNWKAQLGLEVEWRCGCCEICPKDKEAANACKWKDQCMVIACIGPLKGGAVPEVSASRVIDVMV